MVFEIDFREYCDWYGHKTPLFYMIQYFKDREAAVKNVNKSSGMKRCLRLHNTQSIEFVWKYFKMGETPDRMCNWYYSLAKYENGIPLQSPDLCGEDNKRTNAAWTLNHWKHMTSYDYLIDIDAGSWADLKYAHESAVLVHELLEGLNCPHTIRFSGMGFHVVIPGEVLPCLSKDPLSESNQYHHYARLLKKLYSEVSEMIDTGIADSRRLIKVPYSLAVYGSKALVCHPINDKDELYHWTLDMADPGSFITCRGERLQVFSEGGSFQEVEKWLNADTHPKMTMTGSRKGSSSSTEGT